MKPKDAKLPPEVFVFLEAQNKTFADWCREHGFNWNTARDVAIGRIKGRVGLCLKIKKALREDIGKHKKGEE